MNTFGLGALFFGLLLAGSGAIVACSSDSTSNGGGGAGTDGGVTLGDGGSTTPTNAACTAPAANVIATLSPDVSTLVQTADALFVLDRKGGKDGPSGVKTGAIVKLPKTGGTSTVHYVPASASHKLAGLVIAGNDLFTTEYDIVGDTASELVHVAAADGAANVIGTTPASDDGYGELRLADETSVYFFRGDILYRIPRTGGAAVAIANPADGLFGVQLFGEDLYLTQGLSGSAVWRVPRSAASTAAAVKLTADAGCLGQIWAVEGGYYCASTLAVTKLGADFAKGDTVYGLLDTAEDVDGTLPRIAGRDGNVIFFGAKGSEAKPVSFRRFDLGATTSTPIACGIGTWLEAAVDASAIYLLEQTADGSAMQVRKVAR